MTTRNPVYIPSPTVYVPVDPEAPAMSRPERDTIDRSGRTARAVLAQRNRELAEIDRLTRERTSVCG